MKNFFKDIKDKLGTTKLIIICVAVILAIIIIPTGIKCAVSHVSPVQQISGIFTSDEKEIIGNWQGDGALTAYEFHEDGKFVSYISTFCYEGRYEIKGNKITLINSSLSGSVEYKFSITGDKLELKLLKENDEEAEENSKTTYTKVDHISMRSFTDILEEFASSEEAEE